MRRKLYDKLLEWKSRSNGDSAIMIEGARRVGKSYLAEKFAEREYSSYLKIDFSNAPADIIDLFDHYVHDLDTLFSRIQLFYGIKLHERRSVIIFDEVQFCPKARGAIKHLVADGRYDYIETGSLISIKKNVQNILIPSEELTLEMFPMDFEEFLWAMDDEVMMPYIRQQFSDKKVMSPPIHRKAMDYFRQYMIVGGMPQAISKYVATKDFDEVDRIKRNILNLYRNDIRKYGDGEESRITSIFDEIPGQLQRHEKKFRLSSLSDNARMRRYGDAFHWLQDAGIINICYNSTSPNIGLRLNEDRTSLKCYMGDTGLLISMAFDEYGEEIKELYKKLVFGKLEVNEGMLTENIVAQMLRSTGHKLFFFSQSDNKDASNRMEIDFLISKKSVTSRHDIIPIEVKSSKRYTLTSLIKCRDKYGQYLSTPCVIHDKDLCVENDILYIPIYMAYCL